MNRFFIEVVIPALLVCWIVFLGIGAFSGATGFRALSVLTDKVAQRDAELSALIARRERLEQRATMLNPKSLDKDMVEERVRAILGFVEDGDVVLKRSELDYMSRRLGHPFGASGFSGEIDKTE